MVIDHEIKADDERFAQCREKKRFKSQKRLIQEHIFKSVKNRRFYQK